MIPVYSFINLGTLCEADINECLSSPCQHEGICTESNSRAGAQPHEAGYTCSCRPGYTGEYTEEKSTEERATSSYHVFRTLPGFQKLK